MNFKGVIIEESLYDKSCLKDLGIISTKIEQVTESHKIPGLNSGLCIPLKWMKIKLNQ